MIVGFDSAGEVNKNNEIVMVNVKSKCTMLFLLVFIFYLLFSNGFFRRFLAMDRI